MAERRRLVLLLGALSAFPALTIDLYLPSMPEMARDLRADAGLVQLSVTVFMIGLAVGQVVVGPLSDAHGRRRLLLAGLATYVAGSLACLAAPSVGWLVAARVVQSLGAAAATVLARVIARDHVDGSDLTRLVSALMLVNGVATVLGPIVGAQLLTVARGGPSSWCSPPRERCCSWRSPGCSPSHCRSSVVAPPTPARRSSPSAPCCATVRISGTRSRRR